MASETPLYADALVRLGETEPRAVVVDAGLATSMQTTPFRQRFPDRYVNLGIAEANAVGYASGLARRGFRPIVHSFSNFLARRAHDQIAISVALAHVPVSLVGGACGVFDGRNGPSHFAGDDLATFLALPDFRVYEPADGEDLAIALTDAVVGEGPSYLRLRRYGMPRTIGGGVRGATRHVHIAGQSPQATVVAIGNMLDEALTAALILSDDGVGVDLFYVMRIKPLETLPILRSARASRRAIVIENHVLSGGGAQAVVSALAAHGIRTSALTLPDRFLPAGDPRWLLTQTGLDATSLAQSIARELVAEVA